MTLTPPFLTAPCWKRSALLLAALLSACASYQPLPLDKKPNLKESLAELRHDGDLPPVLGIEDVARLAVDNNPDLVAVRAQAHVARSEAGTAGILPNPSISGNYGVLIGGPGSIDALSVGISEDLKSLVTLSARRAAADAAMRQTDASILWQEWQVIGKARMLVVDLVEGDRGLALSRRTLDLLQSRLDRGRAALALGDVTLTALAPDATAVNDLHKQVHDQERLQAQRRSDLNALVGLSGTVPVPLRPELEVPEISPRAIGSLVPGLADRRPDLIALQLGYQAQEAKVRTAILAQFPAPVLGITGGHDNSDVRTLGPQITLDLPVFNRNQGVIAVEQATREQLHEEFSARLASAAGDLQAIATSRTLIGEQLAQARSRTGDLTAMAGRARSAYLAGNLDERSYVDFAVADLTGRQSVLALEQLLLEQRVAVETLTGTGMPALDSISREP
ncbi:MAG: TolC family protein [Telmatospirillum sp.]|nr:TolC family protein [Telmatospirillum sp.]